MNVADNDDAAGLVADVDGHAVALLVEDVRGGEYQAVEDGEGEDGGETGGREVAGGPIEGGGEGPDPFDGQNSIGRPGEGGDLRG